MYAHLQGCIYTVIHGRIAYSSKSLENTCPYTENLKIYGHPCSAILYRWKKKEVDGCALTEQACQRVVLNKEKKNARSSESIQLAIFCGKKEEGR